MIQVTCRHCQERVYLYKAGVHLEMCAPKVYSAIEVEYKKKEEVVTPQKAA